MHLSHVKSKLTFIYFIGSQEQATRRRRQQVQESEKWRFQQVWYEESENGESDKSDKKNQCKEIILKVYMHCEGCASQVSHCLRGYDGNPKT